MATISTTTAAAAATATALTLPHHNLHSSKHDHTSLFPPHHRFHLRPPPASSSGTETRKSIVTPLKDCRLKRRTLIAMSGIVACAVTTLDLPAKGMEMLPYKQEGYNYWDWRGHKVHYVVQGEGIPVVLIHGFGASAFHWRYNIPILAEKYKVYAMDLLGFGWSEKALIEYEPSIWKDQVADFIRDVVQDKAVLVGNSVGGFTVLNTTASYPELVSGLVLVNASGQFDKPEIQKTEALEENLIQKTIFNPIRDWVRKVAIGFAYWQAKQPARIRSVLNNVYIDKTNVDDYLVDSIVHATEDPQAGEVYYRLMSGYLFQPSELTLNKLLAKLSCPLLLLWGDLDPWMGASKADKIKLLYPQSSIVRLQAGHCPHDEAPELVNNALIEWISSSIESRGS